VMIATRPFRSNKLLKLSSRWTARSATIASFAAPTPEAMGASLRLSPTA